VKDSGRPAPSRLVSSSDSGDMAGVVMVPFPCLTKRGSSDSAICSLESCSSPDLQASGREARQQKQKGRAEEVARRTSNCVRGRSAARITLERAKASRAPPLACHAPCPRGLRLRDPRFPHRFTIGNHK
jgi:hypothetical protein